MGPLPLVGLVHHDRLLQETIADLGIQAIGRDGKLSLVLARDALARDLECLCFCFGCFGAHDERLCSI